MVVLRSLFAILLLFCTLEGKAQISFYHVFGGTGYDRGEGIAQLPDSSYIVTGASSSFENAPSQAFLLFGQRNTVERNLKKAEEYFSYRITGITLSEPHPVTEPTVLTATLFSRICRETSNGKNGTTKAVGSVFMTRF